MANQHRYKQKVIRGVPDELANDFDAAAKKAGSDRSAVTRQLWEAWLGYPGAQWPPAPVKGGEGAGE